MLNMKKYLIILRCILVITIFTYILRTYYTIIMPMGFFLGLCPLLVINDFARSNIKKSTSKIYCFSLILSILDAAILKYFIDGFGINVYLILYVIEILDITGMMRQFLLAFHAVLYFAVTILTTMALDVTEKLSILGTGFLTYTGLVCVLYLSRVVRKDREETKKLNEELKLANMKLKEYSLKVEELSIAKERARMSQELHDSLGHSLMALTMHLEFAEKVFDTKPEEIKEILKKAKNIAKNCTGNLRAAVSTLKEERDISGLREAINELSANFNMLGNLKISLNMDDGLEDLNPDIKLCLYKTIREGLTNSIKHGKAAAFDINIDMRNGIVDLNIHDNGTGCDEINESNGLKGIEDRVMALGGITEFKSCKEEGFTIKARIPL